MDDGWKSNAWLRLSFTECDGDCRSCGPDAPWVRSCIVDLIESISGQSIVNVKVVVVMYRPISANDMSAQRSSLLHIWVNTRIKDEMILIGVDYTLLNLVLGCSRRMESRDWVPVRQVSESAISHKSRPPSLHAMSL